MGEPMLPDVAALRAHDPPPGGLARLRSTLDMRDHRARWWRIALPAIAAVAAIALWLGLGREPSRSVAPPPLLADPSVGVAFYWVAPTATRPPAASSPAFVDISAVSISQ